MAWGDRRGGTGVCGVGGVSSASCAWGQRCLRRPRGWREPPGHHVPPPGHHVPPAAPSTPKSPAVTQHPNIPPSTALGQGSRALPCCCAGEWENRSKSVDFGLPQPRCAFRAPSPSQGWGAKIKKDVQGMNIYLWVASDRCWGEDSWILQFAGGNNWNRLMRNILPNSCLPSATAPACSGLWDPNTQSSARLGVQEAAGAQLWWFPHRMEPETRKGMWPLGAGS